MRHGHTTATLQRTLFGLAATAALMLVPCVSPAIGDDQATGPAVDCSPSRITGASDEELVAVAGDCAEPVRAEQDRRAAERADAQARTRAEAEAEAKAQAEAQAEAEAQADADSEAKATAGAGAPSSASSRRSNGGQNAGPLSEGDATDESLGSGSAPTPPQRAPEANATLTLSAVVDNVATSANVSHADFTLSAAGPTAITEVPSGTMRIVNPGTYTLSEDLAPNATLPFGYRATWLCTGMTGLGSGSTVEIAPGDDVSCTVTNTAAPPTLSIDGSFDVVDSTPSPHYRITFDVTASSDLPQDFVLAIPMPSSVGLSATHCTAYHGNKVVADLNTGEMLEIPAELDANTSNITWRIECDLEFTPPHMSTDPDCAASLTLTPAIEQGASVRDKVCIVRSVSINAGLDNDTTLAPDGTWQAHHKVGVQGLLASRQLMDVRFRVNDTHPGLDFTEASRSATGVTLPPAIGEPTPGTDMSFRAIIGPTQVDSSFVWTVNGIRIDYRDPDAPQCDRGGGLAITTELRPIGLRMISYSYCLSFNPGSVQVSTRLVSLDQVRPGNWRAVWELTVTGDDPTRTSGYTLDNELTVPGARLSGLPRVTSSASFGTAPTPNRAWNGVTVEELAASQYLPAGAIHTYRVEAKLAANESATMADLICPIPGQPGGGLNSVATVYPSRASASAPCADLLSYAIGGRAWVDADQDGALDPREQPKAGVGVRLLASKPGSAAGPVVAEATTTSSGHYAFDGLNPGRYQVEVAGVPERHELAAAGPTGVDPTTGRTAAIELGPRIAALTDLTGDRHGGRALAAHLGTLDADIAFEALPGPTDPKAGSPGGDSRSAAAGGAGGMLSASGSDSLVAAIALSLLFLLGGIAAVSLRRLPRP